MQLRQQMDLDQNLDAHHPIKPSKSILPLKRSNRAFGTNITNQHRGFPNEQTHKAQKMKPNEGFNFVKKPFKVEVEPESETSVEIQGETPKLKAKSPSESSAKSPQASITARAETEMDFVEDIELQAWDVSDVKNDLCVTDYVYDIIACLRSDEDSNRGIIPNDMDFMNDFQEDVNARMRVVLVDWLIEVHRKFKLLPSTYFLGINLLDRYLANKQIHRRQLQLCGCTCLWIASKYHEIFAPEMDDFVYISDNAFAAEELMKTEVDILKTLSFTLTVPTVLNYHQRYSKISAFYLKKGREIKIISDLIMYCIEHSVMSYTLCRKVPSMIGAASFLYACLSTKVFSVDTFAKDGIDKAIGYKFDTLVPVMREIDEMVRNAKNGKHKAVYRKYCNAKHSNIGKLNFDKLNTSFLKNMESDDEQ